MRRAPWVLGATAIGLAGLLAFDHQRFGDPLALGRPATDLHLTSAAAPAPQPPPPRSSAPQPAPPTTPTTQRATGAAVANPYGSVQVRATVKAGRLTDVRFLQLPSGDPTSQSISDQVAPVLAQQAIAAQSANVAGVSGATYTSDAYRQSLQSALDALGFGS